MQTEQESEIRKNKRKLTEGIVVSNKMNKTVVVAVTRLVKHPDYGKYVRRTKKLFAHDEKNECNSGDRVRIEETRPLSAKKRWRVLQIIDKAE
jgi:small subunit ribosomal protein S17